MLRWKSAGPRARSPHASRRATAPAARGAAKLEVLELRRLLAADALDTTYGSGGVALHNLGDLAVVASAIDSSDNIAVVGDAVVAQVGPTGTLNWSAPLGPDFAAIDVAIDSLGRIVVAGTNSLQDFVVARFDGSDGSPDTGFATAGVYTELTPGSQEATGVAIGPNDSILVVGTDGSANVAVLRLDIDGAPQEFFTGDNGFAIVDLGTNADSAGGVTFQSDGTAVIAGRTNTETATEDFALALLEPNGDLSVMVTDNGGSEGLASVAVNGSDAIYATATSSTGGFLVRYDASGAFLGATALAGGATVGGVDTDALGNVYVATVPLTFDVLSITRFTSAGTPDAGFGSNGTVQAATTPGAFVLTFDVNVQANGKPVAVGLSNASAGPGDTSFALARWGEDEGGGDVVITGTAGNDTVLITRVTGGFEVFLNGASQGTVNPAGRFVVNLGDGADRLNVSGSLGISLFVDGGAGNDTLKGGSGNDILLGGLGNDRLMGANGRDLMIGGEGADRILGQQADDILIAGSTDHDSIPSALDAIMSEWTSARDFDTRVANLNGTGMETEPRNNGSTFLNLDTVDDDGDADSLNGNGGDDWFMFDGVLDRTANILASEFGPELV